jgi:uncharacterized membrane protein
VAAFPIKGRVASLGKGAAMIRSPLISHVVSFGAALLAAFIVVVAFPNWHGPWTRLVAAYDVFALCLLAWYWLVALQRDARGAGRRAAMEDPGRNVIVVLVVASVAFGFFSGLEILGRRSLDGDPHRAFLYAIGLSAVVLGWFLIHTVFLFRYARLYYGDHDRDNKSDGGLIFPGGREPNDLDFAYFSFVIGMTFQVSDVQISSPAIRKLALAHGLISFAYNTSILALVVNVVAGLLH